jgi:peptidoglycan/LPS O-acetylase OafA/YrhL
MYVVQNFLKSAFTPDLFIASLGASLGSIFWARCSYLILMSLTTILVALLSWHLLEKHFLRMKTRFASTKTKRPSNHGSDSVACELLTHQ